MMDKIRLMKWMKGYFIPTKKAAKPAPRPYRPMKMTRMKTLEIITTTLRNRGHKRVRGVSTLDGFGVEVSYRKKSATVQVTDVELLINTEEGMIDLMEAGIRSVEEYLGYEKPWTTIRQRRDRLARRTQLQRDRRRLARVAA